MNVAAGIAIGIKVAKTIGKVALTAGKATLIGGVAVNKYLQNAMPLEPPRPPDGREDFPPLNVKVSENLNYKIKLLENTTQALGTPEAFSMTRGIVDQINDDTFYVLIVGKFATGKSALLNKLLERDVLKTGGGETTKALAWLMYGKSGGEAAWYHDFANELHQISLEKINEIPDDPPVFNIFACINAEILNHHAVLIDTPGLQASDETAALTNEAMEIADAVILVVDHYTVQANDEQLIQKLKETGKGDRLFVVINKMDNTTPEEQVALIEDRRAWLSNLGVRANIFPLSNTNKLTAIDNDFIKFRDALVKYIENGLDSARDASVDQRIKNTASDLLRQCEEIAALSRERDAGKREAIKADALARMKQFEEAANQTFQNNKREIQRLKQSVLDKWADKLGKIKDEVNGFIQNATGAQLNSINQLFANIQTEINKFLLDEFQAAEDQVRNAITASFSSDCLPVPQQEGQVQINMPVRWGNNINIPAEFGTIGMLAYTFFTRTSKGLFAAIGSLPQLFLIFTLSPLINKLFEQLLKTGLKIGDAAFKTKLQKEINNQWPVIDENIKSKIKEYFIELEDLVDRFVNKIIKAEKDSLNSKIAAADSFANSGKSSELKDFQRKLGKIANKGE